MHTKQNVTTAEAFRLVSVALTSSYQALHKLINAALAAVAKPEGSVIQMILNCDAAYTVKDTLTAGEKTFAASADKIFPVLNADSLLEVKTASTATLTVELYYQK